MIKEILQLISSTGVINTSEIAETIGTTPSMVQQALAMLKLKGYLAFITLNQACQDGHCASCGHCKSTVQSNKCTYAVTEKGKKYLQHS